MSRPAVDVPVETPGTDALGASAELGELRGRPEFESIGVDRIPEAERTSTPSTFFGILVGQSLTMPFLVYGWLAITFGLGVWGALSSFAAGTVVGIVLVVPLMLIGSATATNNSTASGAHFGVRGRLVGAIVGLAIIVVYTALTIWGGGQVTVMILARLFGTPESDLTLAIAYAVLAVGAAFIAIYGYQLMARVEFALLALAVVTFTLMVIAFAGRIDLGYQGGEYVLGSFWNTWALSAVVVGLSGPMSLITLMGDWTRYISPSRFPARKLVPVASLAIFMAMMVPSVLGVLLATAFSDPLGDFFTGLVGEAPSWTVAAMLPLATVGTIGFVAANIYSAGLDLDAIIPRFTRPVTTLIATAVAMVLVFVGSIVWDARDSITAMSLILVAIGTPWAAITGIGYLRCRGRYYLDDLQVFNRGQTGGVYWYANGFNYRAVVAWLAGSLYGCLAIEATPLYTGPLADLAGGVDTSFLGSFVIALVVYLGSERAFPVRQPQNTAITDKRP